MENPVFVVTGAPNKGKSTLVKALTNDESIEINPTAGTTIKSKAYPMKVDQKVMYTIWDTPGFENARGLSEILKEWGIESYKDDPLDLFRRFYKQYRDHEDFKNEIEIFKPIVQYAGIVYVADSSKPFNQSKYIREIELLKWTGLPRIAILNPIDGTEHLGEWQRQLDRHFRIVKVFNPHKTSFHEKLRLLDAFSHLNPEWENKVLEAIEALKKNHELALKKTSVTIRKAVLEAYRKSFSTPTDDLHTKEEYTRILFENVRDYIGGILDESQREIVRHYGFKEQHVQMDFDLNESDVMDEVVMRKYITPWQRGLIGSLTGAGAGAALDVAAGGLTFGVFAALGGAAGAGSAYLSNKFDPMDLLKDVKRKNNRYEVERLHPELGYLIINRLRELASKIRNKTAANQDTITIEYNFDKMTTMKLTRVLKNVIKQGKNYYKEEIKQELGDIIYKQLQEDQKQEAEKR
ncbi:MAG: DUF3482 domain-containing protein, partial [Balneolales bacterium]